MDVQSLFTAGSLARSRATSLDTLPLFLSLVSPMPPTSSSTTTPPPLDTKAIFYMVLLALQFGIQPIVTRAYAPTGIIKSSVVLMQEAVKFGIAGTFLVLSGDFQQAVKGTCTCVFVCRDVAVKRRHLQRKDSLPRRFRHLYIIALSFSHYISLLLRRLVDSFLDYRRRYPRYPLRHAKHGSPLGLSKFGCPYL